MAEKICLWKYLRTDIHKYLRDAGRHNYVIFFFLKINLKRFTYIYRKNSHASRCIIIKIMANLLPGRPVLFTRKNIYLASRTSVTNSGH